MSKPLTSKPSFDADEFLRKLERLIQSKSMETGTGDPLGRVPVARVGKSSLWSLLIPIFIVVGIAVAAWLSRGSNRELAKLRHEKFKTKVNEDRADVLAKHSNNAAVIYGAKKAFDKLSDKLRVIEADIATEEKRHEANINTLRRIRTWDGTYRRYGG